MGRGWEHERFTRCAILSSAVSWYIDTLRRSTHPPRRKPLGLPSPMHTMASMGPDPDPGIEVSPSSAIRSPSCLSNRVQVSEFTHFSRWLRYCACSSSRVNRAGASAGLSTGSASVGSCACASACPCACGCASTLIRESCSFRRGRVPRNTRRTLVLEVTCVQPSSSVTWRRFWVGAVERFLREVCGMVLDGMWEVNWFCTSFVEGGEAW